MKHLVQRMDNMVDNSEIEKVENLMLKEARTIQILNDRIIVLETECNELKGLKSAYGSDTRALHGKI